METRPHSSAIHNLARAVIITAVILMTVSVSPVRAATKTSTGSCNWNTPSCWSPAGAPGAGDDVQILGTHTVTLDSASVTINSLTINSDGVGGACGLTVGANSITVTNDITFISNPSGGICQISISTGAVNASNLTINGGAQPSQVNVTGAGSLTLTNAATINAPTAASVTNQISVGTGTFSAASLDINGGATSSRRSQVTLSTGTVTISGNVTFGAGTPSAQRLDFSGAGTVNIGGNLGSGGTLTASTGTVNLNGATNQNFGGYTFNILTLNNAGTKIPGGAYTVNDTLTIQPGVTLDESTRTLTLPGGATLFVNGMIDFTDANGMIRTGTSGTTTLTMGAGGWIKTIDPNGLGPAANASLDTQTGGAWDVASLSTNGTIEYARNTTSGQIVSDRDYNNLAISGPSQTKIWTLSADRTINADLTINSGAPLTVSGTQTINIKGNWFNSGTFNAGTSTVKFNGASAQVIGGSGATAFNNLEVDNASDVSLGSVNASVNNTLTFSSGKIVTAANTLILGSSGSVSGAGASKYVYGNFQKTVPTGSPAITFEIGDASVYAPISLTFNNVTTSGTLTGSTTGAQHPHYYNANISSSDYVKRYWTLTPSGLTFTSYDVTFTFANPGDLTGAPASLILQKFNDPAWFDPASSSYTSNTVSGTGFTSFSDFFAGQAGVPTPVSLSYFLAARAGNVVNFEWSTETETGNAGFNLYAEMDGQRTPVNTQLIPSHILDSLERQDYSFSATAPGEIFYLQEVSILGETHTYGPFQLDSEYGARLDAAPIDWSAATDPTAALRSDLTTASPSAGGRARPPRGVIVNFQVRQSGLYRVTYEMLREAGFDLGGVPSVSLKLSNRGQAVPIFIRSAGKFGPGDFIEFYGEALDTAYTDTNSYTLSVDTSPPAWIPADRARPPVWIEPPASFDNTIIVNNQRVYANYAPGADAWYDTYMMVYDSACTWEFPFEISGLVDDASPANMQIILWGLTSWPQNNDHHMRIAINGDTLTNLNADGFGENDFVVNIPAGVLREGENILQVTLTAEAGLPYDVVALDRFNITYPRTFEAQDGRLTFTAAGDLIQVSNLPSKNIVAYRIDAQGLVRLANLKVEQTDGTFTMSVAGTAQPARYFVSAVEELLSPALSAPRPSANLQQPAQYIIISHPSFLADLELLIQARRTQGFTVNAVDVNDLYAQYSSNILDPQAIKEYITYAHRHLGAEYILLVGGDTYDYRNYLGINSVSFIPSLYADTGLYSRFIPADPLFADVDNDNVPDIAIGRFPVRTTAELEAVISKTLAYDQKDYGRTAIFVSDRFDGLVSFKNINNGFAALLPGGWSVQNIHLDDLPAAEARTKLLDAMNDGTSLITFSGHSGPASWTFHNLFNITDATALTNDHRPFVVVQWGCWNTYYVDPVHNYLVHSLLVSGDRGAAAVLGAVSRTDSNSEILLGQHLTPRLVTHGMTIGQALLLAKQDLAVTHPNLLDVLLGWSLMGDPALVIQP